MQTLAAAARFELAVLASVLAALVSYKLLTGSINTRGLLRDKSTGDLSPERIQLLVLTLVTAATIPLQLDRMEVAAQVTLPSGYLVPVIGTSHLIYLVRKYVLFKRTRAR